MKINGDIPINPGVVRLVTLLNENGFVTCDSGDGATHAAECDREYPYACMVVDDANTLVSESLRLVEVMRRYGVEVQQQDDGDAPCIQASFDPITKTAIIDLMNVTDAMLKT